MVVSAGATDPQEFPRLDGHPGRLPCLVDRLRSLPQANSLALLDNTGRIVNFSHTWPVPVIDAGDRDFFTYLREHDDPAAIISVPVVNRFTHAWVLMLARRIDGPHGEFVGVVVGVVEARYFENFYKEVRAGESASASLFRRDGVLLARYPRIRMIWSVRDCPAASETGIRRWRKVRRRLSYAGLSRRARAHRLGTAGAGLPARRRGRDRRGRGAGAVASSGRWIIAVGTLGAVVGIYRFSIPRAGGAVSSCQGTLQGTGEEREPLSRLRADLLRLVLGNRREPIALPIFPKASAQFGQEPASPHRPQPHGNRGRYRHQCGQVARASRRPGAPPSVSQFRLLAKVGDRAGNTPYRSAATRFSTHAGRFLGYHNGARHHRANAGGTKYARRQGGGGVRAMSPNRNSSRI